MSTGDLSNLSALKLTAAEEAAARAEAERIVTAHRSAIDRIACELCRWGCIDGAEAKELFNLNK